MSGLPSPIERHRIRDPVASTRSSSTPSAVAVTAARRLVGPTGPRVRCVLARSAAAHATRRPPYGLVMAPPPADTLHHQVEPSARAMVPPGVYGCHRAGRSPQESRRRTRPECGHLLVGVQRTRADVPPLRDE